MNKVNEYIQNAYCKSPESYFKYRLGLGRHLEDGLVDLILNVYSIIGNKNSRILDLGCGFDPVMARIPNSYYIGIDLSEKLIEKHPLFGTPNTEFHVANIYDFNYDNLSYDIVNATLVLHYIENPAALIQKVCKKNAGFCFVIPNPDFDQKEATIDCDGLVELEINGYQFRYFYHPLKKIMKALRNAKELYTEYASKFNAQLPPVYICLYGKW